jgi:hypothetical protein
MLRLNIFAFSILFFAACSKETIKSKTPSITLRGVNPGTVQQGSTDTLRMTLKIEDGDADLFVDGETPSLFLTDSRDRSKLSGYALPSIDPALLDPAYGFEGNIDLKIPAATLLLRTDDTARTRDTLQYDIYLTDRAKHKSNTVTTSPIYITK